MNKVYKCFSIRLANHLARNGFEIIDTELNMKYKNLKVFIFRYSEKLLECVFEYSKSK